MMYSYYIDGEPVDLNKIRELLVVSYFADDFAVASMTMYEWVDSHEAHLHEEGSLDLNGVTLECQEQDA